MLRRLLGAFASERRAKHPPSVLSAPGQCAPIPSHTHGHFMPPRNTRTAERNTQGRENYLSRERQLLLDERSGLRPPEWSHAEAKGKNCYDRTKLVKGRRTYQSRERGQRNEQDILSLPLFLTRQPPLAPQSERRPRQRARPPRLPPPARRPPFPGRKRWPRRSCRSPHPSRAHLWPPIPGCRGRRAAAVGIRNGQGRGNRGGQACLLSIL